MTFNNAVMVKRKKTTCLDPYTEHLIMIIQKTQQQSQAQQCATNRKKEDDSGKDLKVMSITFVYDAFLLRKTSTQYILNIISCPLYIHLTFVIFNS